MDKDYGYMCSVTLTLGQGYDTPFQESWITFNILTKSNMTVVSYGLDKDYGYKCMGRV